MAMAMAARRCVEKFYNLPLPCSYVIDFSTSAWILHFVKNYNSQLPKVDKDGRCSVN